MSSKDKIVEKVKPAPSSSPSPKVRKRNRREQLLSSSNPHFDTATGKFRDKDALFAVQKHFVLGCSRRVRRKVKEAKAEVVTKERDPDGPSFTDELEVKVEKVERALNDTDDA